ncbi:MAG TPA: YciI family protein, partial [Ramlibacter sp.]|nr:YciI family protein [Ramlibacter sp.]
PPCPECRNAFDMEPRALKTLMFYELAADSMAKVHEHYPAHAARLREFHARGVLLMAGPYGNPPVGALSVFTTRQAAEEFAAGDPFVVHGIVARSTIQDWDEGLGE